MNELTGWPFEPMDGEIRPEGGFPGGGGFPG